MDNVSSEYKSGFGDGCCDHTYKCKGSPEDSDYNKGYSDGFKHTLKDKPEPSHVDLPDHSNDPLFKAHVEASDNSTLFIEQALTQRNILAAAVRESYAASKYQSRKINACSSIHIICENALKDAEIAPPT